MNKCVPVDKKVCESFTACTIAGSLVYDAAKNCLSYEPNANLINGWVRAFQIQDGCIVAYSFEEQDPTYIAPPCAPLPADCSGNGSGGYGYTISADAANLTRIVNGELLTKLHIRGKDGITVTGLGPFNSPIEIGYQGADTGWHVIGTAPVNVTGNNTTQDPLNISLGNAGMLNGTANGISFEFGLARSFDNSTTVPPNITGGWGITVLPAPGAPQISQISQTDLNTSGSYQWGAWFVTVDQTARIASLRRTIDLGEPKEIKIGDTTLFFNEDGSLTGFTGGGGTPPPPAVDAGNSWSYKVFLKQEEYNINMLSGTKLRIRIEGFVMPTFQGLNFFMIDGNPVSFDPLRDADNKIIGLLSIHNLSPGVHRINVDITDTQMNPYPYIFMDATL